MQLTNQLLQVSANLYKTLGDISKGGDRDDYIKNINNMLDKRGAIIDALKLEGFHFDEQNRGHRTLFELDNGIKERLGAVMSAVKQDMANFQKTKKTEAQYINPYGSIRIMDGMYYDKKN